MPSPTNVIGDRGEMIVSTRLMEYNLFQVFLLGGKVPSFDLLVEMIPQNANEKPYQFLVQVKTTSMTNCFTLKHRLKTPVPHEKLDALIDRPLPSYAAGVDLNTEDVYLVPCFDTNSGYSGSIPTNNRLVNKPKTPNNLALLQRLKSDIIDYWHGLNIDTYKPQFNSTL